jgi:Spy/CpxP family protein refolding chaperone
MRNWKFTGILAGSMLLILVLAATVGAQQRNRAQFRGEFAGKFSVRQFVRNLQISSAQREEIRAILQAHKPEIVAARENLLRARIALLNNDANASNDFGAARAQIMELRQAIANQIEPIFTADQLATLQNRRQKQLDLLNRRLQRLQELGAN